MGFYQPQAMETDMKSANGKDLQWVMRMDYMPYKQITSNQNVYGYASDDEYIYTIGTRIEKRKRETCQLERISAICTPIIVTGVEKKFYVDDEFIYFTSSLGLTAMDKSTLSIARSVTGTNLNSVDVVGLRDNGETYIYTMLSDYTIAKFDTSFQKLRTGNLMVTKLHSLVANGNYVAAVYNNTCAAAFNVNLEGRVTRDFMTLPDTRKVASIKAIPCKNKDDFYFMCSAVSSSTNEAGFTGIVKATASQLSVTEYSENLFNTRLTAHPLVYSVTSDDTYIYVHMSEKPYYIEHFICCFRKNGLKRLPNRLSESTRSELTCIYDSGNGIAHSALATATIYFYNKAASNAVYVPDYMIIKED